MKLIIGIILLIIAALTPVLAILAKRYFHFVGPETLFLLISMALLFIFSLLLGLRLIDEK